MAGTKSETSSLLLKQKNLHHENQQQQRNDDLLLFHDDESHDDEEIMINATTSFALSSKRDDVEDDYSVLLPTPKRYQQQHRTTSIDTASSARTPLNPRRQQRKRVSKTTNVLFGNNWALDNSSTTKHGNDSSVCCFASKKLEQRPTGMAGFFFGFMYEDPIEDEDEDDQHHDHSVQPPVVWNNRFNRVLCVSHLATCAAAVVPVTLIPYLIHDEETSASVFSSKAAAFAVLGTACGKFINGPMGDVFDARKVSCLYSILLACSLWTMTYCESLWSFFLVEFFQSVQWPCMIVLLASRYNHDASSSALYEGGVFVTFMASRLGTVVAIPACSYYLQETSWKAVAQSSAVLALMGGAVMYFLVPNTPLMNTRQATQTTTPLLHSKTKQKDIQWNLVRIRSCVTDNLLPSVRTVMKSGTFWIVAMAHAGGCMVRSSEKILGSYLADTSSSSSTRGDLSFFAIVLDIGILLGLGVFGQTFSWMDCWYQKKRLVGRLYMLTIASCYVLGLLAIPTVQKYANSTLLFLGQLLAIMCTGMGVAVPLVHIPSIVGITSFASSKGLYSAYTDGVASGLASFVWRIVGNAVEEQSKSSVGWAYGWAAVALLVILCGVLMVEFIYHYFCRHRGQKQRPQDGYETITFV